MRFLAFFFVLLLAVPHAAAQTIAPGAGFDVERYAVAIRPDLVTTAVAGTETITLRATSDRLAQVAFTANALRVSDATANGAPAQISSSENAIVFTLPRPLRRGGRATLRFRIDGRPARGLVPVPGGLYASYFACDWMVCLQDSPGDKAALSLDLILPAGTASLGPGRALSETELAAGLVRHRWRTTRPYSPYLYAFAAGHFDRRSVPTGSGELVYLDATGGKADLDASFGEAPAIAAFFAGKAGTPLPDGRYTELLVPGDEAQEEAGFSLIGKAYIDGERDDASSAWVIAHEMAHQWWGDLVTCATWRDFWLNEGIATFMVAAWKEQRFGVAAYRQELDVATKRLDRARAIGFDKPLGWDGKYPSLRVRRAVQYSKGALFLAHLRETIGAAAFWRGLRSFTRAHSGGTVTSRDFERAMERASGRDLSTMFAKWVYGESTMSPNS